MSIERDAYAILQVDPKAESLVISAAYRALARRCHPDGPSPDPAKMAELNGAYDKLKTVEARQRFDATRQRMVAVGPGATVPTYDAWPDASSPRSGTGAAMADGSAVIDFGRYDGWRIVDIARTDPDYLRWLSRHSTGIRFRQAIARVLPSEKELGRGARVLG